MLFAQTFMTILGDSLPLSPPRVIAIGADAVGGLSVAGGACRRCDLVTGFDDPASDDDDDDAESDEVVLGVMKRAEKYVTERKTSFNTKMRYEIGCQQMMSKSAHRSTVGWTSRRLALEHRCRMCAST